MQLFHRTTLRVFLGLTLVAFCIRWFVLEGFRVESRSMEPGLVHGDFILVSKFNFSLQLPFSNFEFLTRRRPERGEIVCLSVPTREFKGYLVKRVVGIAGDHLSIRSGVLHINGFAAHYDRIADGEPSLFWERWDRQRYQVVWDPTRIPDFGPVEIPSNHLFVLSDNRIEENDSRKIGPIPFSCVKGKAGLVLASVDKSLDFRMHRTAKWVQ